MISKTLLRKLENNKYKLYPKQNLDVGFNCQLHNFNHCRVTFFEESNKIVLQEYNISNFSNVNISKKNLLWDSYSFLLFH